MQKSRSEDINILGEETLYTDNMFSLRRVKLKHRLHGGEMSEPLSRIVFDRGDSSAILLYHPESDSVVLTYQFRAGACQDEYPWCKEIVAGVIDHNETAEEAASRESMEEVGVAPYEVISIMTLHPSPGACNEKIHIYLGLIDRLPRSKARGVRSESEDVMSLVVPLDHALAGIADGEMNGAGTIIALQWLALQKKMILDSIS